LGTGGGAGGAGFGGAGFGGGAGGAGFGGGAGGGAGAGAGQPPKINALASIIASDNRRTFFIIKPPFNLPLFKTAV